MAFNSTIKQKKCKCGCGKFPTIGFDGWFYGHAPEEMKLKKGLKAKVSYQAKLKRAKKSSLSRKLHEEQSEVYDRKEIKGSSELQRWFLDRRKEMTGVCQNCGGRTCRDNDSEYKRSIAHILPKAYFPSIATNPNNFIELCFYGNSCHTNYDNKMIDLIDLHCFDDVIQKFVKMFPFISQIEKRRIPKILLDYIEVEK